MDRLAVGSPEFEILAELGRGTTGVVYKARQNTVNQVVALKLPRVESPSETPIRRDRFLREAQVLAHLTGDPDSDIPTLYAFGMHDEQPYFVREFVEGRTLEQLVTAGAPGSTRGRRRPRGRRQGRSAGSWPRDRASQLAPVERAGLVGGPNQAHRLRACRVVGGDEPAGAWGIGSFGRGRRSGTEGDLGLAGRGPRSADPFARLGGQHHRLCRGSRGLPSRRRGRVERSGPEPTNVMV